MQGFAGSKWPDLPPPARDVPVPVMHPQVRRIRHRMRPGVAPVNVGVRRCGPAADAAAVSTMPRSVPNRAPAQLGGRWIERIGEAGRRRADQTGLVQPGGKEIVVDAVVNGHLHACVHD
jgi:hypothetical protein